MRCNVILASIITAFALVLTPAAASIAKDRPEAETVRTIWLNGKGQSSMAAKLNELHARMEQQGWRFADLDLYTENGDMEGFFVTYVRADQPSR